jgi:hypothetical protein
MFGEVLGFTGKGFAILSASIATLVSALLFYKGIAVLYTNESDPLFDSVREMKWFTPRRAGVGLISIALFSLMLTWSWVFTTQNHPMAAKLSGGLAGFEIARMFI